MEPAQKQSRNKKALINWIAKKLISEKQPHIQPPLILGLCLHVMDWMINKSEFLSQSGCVSLTDFNSDKQLILKLIVCSLIYILFLVYFYVISMLFLLYFNVFLLYIEIQN